MRHECRRLDLTNLIKLQRGIRMRDEFHQSAELEEVGGIVTPCLPGNEKEFSVPFGKWVAARATGRNDRIVFQNF